MIHFGQISAADFLSNYWQKQPLLIKQALPGFISPISADELAGLSLEEVFESRLITGAIKDNRWSLESGPFSEQVFAQLPEHDWTLLVQGVDRFIPEVYELVQHFDFIPRWRFDDVMISYATTGGSVGPHFDYYDVFLLQGSGKRRWQLSHQNCTLDNYLKDTPLRIMDKFKVEMELEVEPGDVLYIPPKVAHHGVSLSDDCTTLSFGYRSYTGKELFENCPEDKANSYYQDPIWQSSNTPALIPKTAINQANLIAPITEVEFAKFATKLDTLDQKILQELEFDTQDELFDEQENYQLHPVCKVAYIQTNKRSQFFVNGEEFSPNAGDDEMINFCNSRVVNAGQNPQLAQQLFSLNLIQAKPQD